MTNSVEDIKNPLVVHEVLLAKRQRFLDFRQRELEVYRENDSHYERSFCTRFPTFRRADLSALSEWAQR